MNPKQRSVLTKIFALSGTILLAGPILFMLVTAVFGSIASKAFLFDYLMLAELFPLVALGLILLFLAGLLARAYAKWFGWGAFAAIVALAAGQLFATATGLASGALNVANGRGALAVVIVCIAFYDLAVICLALLGVRLVRDLFQKKPEQPSDADAATPAA